MLSPKDYSKVKDKEASDQLFKLYVEGKFTEYDKSIPSLLNNVDIITKAFDQIEKSIEDLKTEIGNVREVATSAKISAKEAKIEAKNVEIKLQNRVKPTYWERFYKLIK